MKNLLPCIVLIMVLAVPYCANGSGMAQHMAVYESFRFVDRSVGGLKGAEWSDVIKTHFLIDGTSGRRHRHDGSHDITTVVRIATKQGIPPWVAFNVTRIHIYQDMVWSDSEGGKDGVNGYDHSPDDSKKAAANLERMKQGQHPIPLTQEKEMGPKAKPQSDQALAKAGCEKYQKHEASKKPLAKQEPTKNPLDVRKENPNSKILKATSPSRLETQVLKSSWKFSKLIKWVFRSSAFFSIMVSGYTVPAEIYHAKMAGKEIHPSRLVLRAFVGFAGGLAGGFLLGIALGFLFFWFHPAAVTAGIIGAAIGGVLGTIGAEWLFELIMPNKGLGYIILDILIGGVFGSTIGTVVGLIRGLRATPPIEISGLWKTLWEILKFPFELLASCLDGAICGLVLGGFAGSTLFFVTFVVM
ncbi:MAG: hypothetical protein A4E60_02858 [Syntrophorhabdus sp. PtaB.Bin047]|nr:MAG: hypothetical protein A4E60_02858 [Syntrophorhabdus sp. PtaB.Bin047]